MEIRMVCNLLQRDAFGCRAGKLFRVGSLLLVIASLSLPWNPPLGATEKYAVGRDGVDGPPQSPAVENLEQAIATVCSVDVNGHGHDLAVPAMKIINASTIDQIPEILAGMDGANRLAVNWLRSAVLAIVDRGKELPREEIKSFFNNKSHHPLARLLAFDLLTEGNEELAENMIPDLIDDPSLPLRAKAVQWRIKKSETAATDEERIGILAVALDQARDVDQIQELAKRLKTLGVAIDLQAQFGFLNTWHIVGPFSNRDRAGFDAVYGPEKKPIRIDLSDTYQADDDQTVAWHEHTTSSSTGIVDLNRFVAQVKEVTAYAFTTFEIEEGTRAEIRIGSPNATKVWVNGELVMSNEIYHNSNSIDKFTGAVDLKQGSNQIMVKVCQNEQTESWTVNWEFQLRVCDVGGKVIHSVSK